MTGSRRPAATGQDGFVMVAAIIVLGLMATIGVAVLTFANVQQSQTGLERVSESSFQLTEGALQSQVFELGRAWPGSPGSAVPPGCNPTSGTAVRCPDGVGLNAAYTGADYQNKTCPVGTPTVPWTTVVRDNGGTTGQYYSRTAVDAQPSYDANQDGKLWVRSQGVANCRVQTHVAIVAQTLVQQSFPMNAITSNWFKTTNKGRKVIVSTKDVVPPLQSAKVSLRCQSAPSPCADYQKDKGHVTPDTTTVEAGTSPVMSDDQIASFRAQAKALGTYFPGCPGNALAGKPPSIAFVENAGANCSLGAGFTEAKPGFLVVYAGAVTIGGNDNFYGLLYMANRSTPPITGAVVSLQGNSSIQGGIAIDGPGGVSAGSSKVNIVFDSRAFDQVKTSRGAGIVQNSWRVLPAGQ